MVSAPLHLFLAVIECNQFFYIDLFYPAILLNTLAVSHHFSADFDFYSKIIISSTNSDHVISYLILKSFISFFILLLGPSVNVESNWHPLWCHLSSDPSWPVFYYSVQFSRLVVSDSLQPHGLQHTRLSCPSPTLGACLLLRDIRVMPIISIRISFDKDFFLIVKRCGILSKVFLHL